MSLHVKPWRLIHYRELGVEAKLSSGCKSTSMEEMRINAAIITVRLHKNTQGLPLDCLLKYVELRYYTVVLMNEIKRPSGIIPIASANRYEPEFWASLREEPW